MPAIKSAAIRDRNSLRIYGCSESVVISLNQGIALRSKDSLALKYTTQRLAAARRGIDWRLTFPEWVEVWKASGFLHLRGVGVGRYVMARKGDAGAYSVENVQIELAVVNSRDGLTTRRVREKLLHATH